jgi:hypothetical protein
MTLRNKNYLFRGMIIFALIFFMSSCNNAVPTMSGYQDIEVTVGSEMPDFLEGIELTDAIVDDITVDSSLVNLDVVGNYIVTYTITTDPDNPIEYEITVHVVDNQVTKSPMILGVEDATYVIGQPYHDYMNNVTAVDPEYGDLTSHITINNNGVDLTEPGTYDVIYQVENIDGYSTSVSATVTVVYSIDLPVLPTEFIIVEYNGFFGLTTTDGTELLPIEYDVITYVGDGMLYLEQNSYSYYFDSDALEFYQYEYEPLSPFYDGLTVVRNDFEKLGYMNKEGEVLIPFIYDYVTTFLDDLAIVSMGDNTGVIDTQGNIVIDIMYDSIYYFIEGTFSKELNEVTTIVTYEDEFVIEVDNTSYTIFTNEDGTIIYRVLVDDVSVLLSEELEIISDDLSYLYLTQISDEVFYNYNSYGLGDLYTIIGNDIELIVGDVYGYNIDGEDLLINSEDGWGVFNLNNRTLEIEPQYVSLERYSDTDNLYIVRNDDEYLGVITSLNHVQFGFDNKAVEISTFDIDSLLMQYLDEDGNVGLLDSNGLKLTYDVYESIRPFREGVAVVTHKETGLKGYIDETGLVVVYIDLLDAFDFYNGFAIIKDLDEVSGYRVMNADYQLITTTHYMWINPFEDERAMVLTEDYLYGFIDTSGVEVIPPTYANANTFSNGYTKVQFDSANYNSWGLIDVDGTVIVPGQYSYVGPVYDGMVEVKDLSGGTGYYNVDGEYIIPIYPADPHYGNAFQSGRVVMYHYNIGAEREYIVYDTEGNIIIDYTQNTISDYGDGLARFYNPDTNETGFYDQNGDISFVLPLEFSNYSSVYWFSGGLAPFYDSNTNRYGYIDKTGAIAIEPIYKNYTNFTDDSPYALVEVQYSGSTYNWTLIDKDGNQPFGSIYEISAVAGGYQVHGYWGVTFFVEQDGDKLLYSLVDNNGIEFSLVYDQGWSLWNGANLIIPTTTGVISYEASSDLFKVYVDGQNGLYDKIGNIILEPIYDSISVKKDQGYIEVTVDGNHGIYSMQGELIVPIIYDKIIMDYFMSDNVIIVKNGDMYGMYSGDGELLLPVEFYSIELINSILGILPL